jgi:hypothetical protein
MQIRRIQLHGTRQTTPLVLAARCPHCGHEANFESAGTQDIRGSNILSGVNHEFLLGIRRCPRDDCHGQLFIQQMEGITTTFPAIKIDFSLESIPEKIAEAIEEALQCEAIGCYVAAAIMVRKTLEMVCSDRGATGNSLLDRIKSLEAQVALPAQLFTAMQNLRILGNDAAHVESKDFEQIGDEELIVAIDLAKEILKAIYQLDSIVNRLEAMKKDKVIVAKESAIK